MKFYDLGSGGVRRAPCCDAHDARRRLLLGHGEARAELWEGRRRGDADRRGFHGTRGLQGEPLVQGGLQRPNGARGGARRGLLRPKRRGQGRGLRAAPAALLHVSRPHHDQPPGQRRGHAVRVGHLRARLRAAAHRGEGQVRTAGARELRQGALQRQDGDDGHRGGDDLLPGAPRAPGRRPASPAPCRPRPGAA